MKKISNMLVTRKKRLVTTYLRLDLKKNKNDQTWFKGNVNGVINNLKNSINNNNKWCQ